VSAVWLAAAYLGHLHFAGPRANLAQLRVASAGVQAWQLTARSVESLARGRSPRIARPTGLQLGNNTLEMSSLHRTEWNATPESMEIGTLPSRRWPSFRV